MYTKTLMLMLYIDDNGSVEVVCAGGAVCSL